MKGLTRLFFFAVLILIIFFGQTISLYTDWLWFQEVGYTKIFTTSLTFKLALALVFGGLFFLLVYFNVKLAARAPRGVRFLEQENAIELPSPELVDPVLRRLLLPIAILLGLFAAPQAAGHWQSLLLFFNSVPFGIADPLFGRDISFYVFRLPALTALYNWLTFSLGLTILATAFTYLLYRGVQYGPRGLFLSDRARGHLLCLLAVFLLVKAGGYYLDAFELLYSSRGAAYGATYADVYANLPALRVLALLALIASGLSLLQIYRPGFKYLFVGVGGLILVHLAGLNLYPSFVQRFRVVPNEAVAERMFIERNIQFTRRAYGLDKIESKDFPADEKLTAADLRRNDPTIKNIRLWEHRPLLATYAQLQEIRTYYKFVDVDNDRYLIDGTYRQVMLSAREISHQHLPSRIWINEHLTYTHGYGVVFGPVNQVTPEGLPEFFIKDIPPVSVGPLKITRPEIYYGELANDYVFVKTKAQELDYPAGDQNIYTAYTGKGGVPVSSLWRKLLFSARYATLRIALSNDVTRESRILYHRQIQERVMKIAPFITFDRDAYLVIAQGGRLFWIIDGYTTSDRYPYSEPTRRVGNYIRNSVKAVVDAYDGTVSFYLSSPDDPIILAYAKIFPGLLKRMEAMPEDLRAHIRYPEDLFVIQTRMYATYHMQDPQVFYNKEDLLSIPRKAVDGQDREMEPYYTIMRLPGEKKEEFVLLLPFTPNKKDNMRAWLAARSDPPHYGKLIALDFPKAKLVYGPKQIDARIDQDASISQQLSLWNQRGSQAIRGSLLAIPIEQSLLYIQPLYLAAEKGSLPELKRVIVAFGNQIAMEENLELALQRIFGGRAAPVTVQTGQVSASAGVAGADKSLARRAMEHYTRSQEYLRQGNLAGFGEELKRLEALLKEMQKGR
ncbi:MAG: hypothetical protein A3C54_05950 [Deltaproteobacteria bacterium RIFCSPHIGHO2_02_FULL_60_17]|nr:MAG: hypothetical protein A3C54_05950 [Deltaproteobacteria bacterium RIFCSPHIGHO2_02_FULL_60_17]